MNSIVSSTIENNILTLAFNGRVDSNNAALVESQCFSALSDIVPRRLVIDCRNLEYISSAGLRVLLKLKKTIADMELVNVSLDVHEILDVTGFTEILTVKKALRKVSLAGCEELGHGGHGKVYRLDADTIIKIYTDGSTLEQIDKERSYGRNAFVQGVSCAIAFDVVETELGYGLVFEIAGADTVSRYVTKHPDKIEECGRKMGELLKKLNTTEADPALYGDIKQIYKERLENATEYFTAEESQTLIRLLDAVPVGSGMIHGDFHPNNVMVQENGELILIDMADISRGAPLYDIGGAYLVMVTSAARDHSLAPLIMGVDYETSLALWSSMMKVYLGTEDAATLAMYSKLFGAFCLLRMASTLGFSDNARARANLIANADGICRLFQMPL